MVEPVLVAVLSVLCESFHSQSFVNISCSPVMAARSALREPIGSSKFLMRPCRQGVCWRLFEMHLDRADWRSVVQPVRCFQRKGRLNVLLLITQHSECSTCLSPGGQLATYDSLQNVTPVVWFCTLNTRTAPEDVDTVSVSAASTGSQARRG